MINLNGWKNRKESIVIAAFVCMGVLVVAAYSYVWTMCSREAEQQDALNFQVDQLWPMVQVGAPEPSSDQEERLKIAQEDLNAQQGAFPTKMGHTELMETLLKLANEHNVSLNLQAQLSPAEFGEGGGYFVMRSGARASGTLSDLVLFIAHLEDGPIET